MADMDNEVKNPSGSAVRFVSWNVKGLNGPVKRTRIFTHIKRLKTEIAFLQETHLRIEDHNRLEKHGLARFTTLALTIGLEPL